MTALALATHLAMSDAWFLGGIVKGAYEMPDPKAAEQFKKASQLVAFYDETLPGLLAQVKSMSGEKISMPIQLFDWNMPGLNYLNVMLMHSSHHRGQLSAYLRPMGAKVPSIYGGSADTAAAAAQA